MDDVMFRTAGRPSGGNVDTVAVTRRRAQANAPAASYRLRRIPGDAGAKTRRKRRRERSLRCTITLFVLCQGSYQAPRRRDAAAEDLAAARLR